MLPFKRIQTATIKPGSLVSFQYLFYKNDPRPLVLVTGIYSDSRIAGINLHYLTYRYIKNLLKNFCGNTTFSYQRIKGDKFLYKSFRNYKKNGIKSIHALDCNALNQALNKVKSFNFNPLEIQNIQNSIREQIQNVQNPPAENISAEGMLGQNVSGPTNI